MTDCSRDRAQRPPPPPPPPDAAASRDELAGLAARVAACRGLFVLTGAGCSTGSGIPDYRDHAGQWKRTPPVELRAFMTSGRARARYWARSALGWPAFSAAQPGRTHRALVRLERAGLVTELVTQNVDGLHQRAGSQKVIDLHGRNDRVQCVGCGERIGRDRFQGELLRRNPDLAGRYAAPAPDGDADLEDFPFEAFNVPGCARCGGIMKPAVVFFGDAVPRDRVARAFAALEAADALLAVGTSLMVYSGYRFCRAADEQGKPVLIVNAGKTRADGIAALKVEDDCGRTLEGLLARVLARPGQARASRPVRPRAVRSSEPADEGAPDGAAPSRR